MCEIALVVQTLSQPPCSLSPMWHRTYRSARRGRACRLMASFAAIAIGGTAWTVAAAASQQAAALPWFVVSSPTISLQGGQSRAYLDSVACASADSCLAVGITDNFYSQASAYASEYLVERYDGHSWTIAHPSLPGVTPAVGLLPENQLAGVSCPSTSYCMVVGTQSALSLTSGLGAGAAGAVVEVYNGKTWSAIRPPAGAGMGLDSVSCPGAGSCVVVGRSRNGDIVSYSYQNDRWSALTFIGAAPNVDDGFNSVSCASLSSCMVVGYAGAGTGASSHRFAELLTGRSWILAIDQAWQEGSTSGFAGTSCSSTRTCIAIGGAAVGPWRGASTPYSPIVEMFSADQWRALPAPPGLGSSGATLGGVACTAGRCVVVGTKPDEAVIDTSSNGRWGASSSSLPLPSGAHFSSLSCPTVSFCAAVGATAHQPLVVIGSNRL
ncbi:MAG: hypothetical protein JWO62_994 [Acidimicrobiaceae bacterium]|nr:hypothetical protein [Acidimicrobiaceae bacterium]